MTVEERIKRLKDGIEFHESQREWLRSVQWGESRNADVVLGRGLDDAISEHDRIISTYHVLVARLTGE